MCPEYTHKLMEFYMYVHVYMEVLVLGDIYIL